MQRRFVKHERSGDDLDRDRSLLLAFHRGSDAAARELWARHAGALRAYARSIAGDEGADDVVQTVFLSVLRLRRARVRAVEDPAAWLCTLTRRTALNARRTSSRAHRRDEGAALHKAQRDERPELDSVLEGVPPACREALVLRHAYGFTLERLAEALGVSRSTAADRYAKGLAFARQTANAPHQQEVTEHAR